MYRAAIHFDSSVALIFTPVTNLLSFRRIVSTTSIVQQCVASFHVRCFLPNSAILVRRKVRLWYSSLLPPLWVPLQCPLDYMSIWSPQLVATHQACSAVTVAIMGYCPYWQPWCAIVLCGFLTKANKSFKFWATFWTN